MTFQPGQSGNPAGNTGHSTRRKGTREAFQAIKDAGFAASGRTPLEIMLESARWAYAQATQLTEQLAEADPSLNTAELLREITRFRGLAVAWANCAAAYCHPRLAAVAHRHAHEDGSPVKPIVNVYIDGVPQGDHRGPLGEPGDNIADDAAATSQECRAISGNGGLLAVPSGRGQSGQGMRRGLVG